MGILPKRGLNDLYGVEVAVLPKKQATHHGQEPVGGSSAIEVVSDYLPRLVHPLPVDIPPEILLGQANVGYALALEMIVVVTVVMVGYSLLLRRTSRWMR